MTYINLLPETLLQRQLLYRSLRRWIVVWAAGGLVAGLVTSVERRNYSVACARRAAVEAKYLPLRNMEKEIDRLKRRLAHLRIHAPADLTSVRRHPVTSALALVSNSAAQCRDQLYLRRLAFQEQFPSPRGASRETPPRVSLDVSGVAENNLVIAQFAASLRESGYFRHVDVEVTPQQTAADHAKRQYRIACTLE